ncbi:MAG: polysaccharide biosynthesis C-terminal domain-containing protein [Candidatus Methanoperedens sp.]
MDIYKSFIKDNLLILSGHILIYLQGIILMPIIIKSVGVTIYGGYVLLTSALGFLFGISSLGVGFRCKRYLPSSTDKKLRCELFYPQLLFQIISIFILSLAILLLEPFMKDWFLNNKIEFMILLAPLFLWLSMFYSQAADYFRYTGRMSFFNYATVLMPYINIGIVVLFLYSLHDLNINLLISAQIISMLLITTPLFFSIYNEIGFNFPTMKINELISDIKLGFPIVLGYVTNFVVSSSDRYVIALFLSVTAVGYYNPAYGLGSLIIFYPMVSGIVLPPLLSKAVDNGKEHEARVMIDYTIKGFLFIGIPFLLGSYVMSKPLLTMFANAEVAENAYLIVPVVAMGMIFYGLIVILSNVLFVQMKTSAIFRVNVIAALLNLTLNLVLIYIFRDIMMAALSTLFSYFIAFILITRTVAANWPLNFNLSILVKPVVASILMIIPLFWISSQLTVYAHQPLYILGEVLISGAVYIVALSILGAFSRQELVYLKGVFSK